MSASPDSFILSIICGDNHLHWAFHKGIVAGGGPDVDGGGATPSHTNSATLFVADPPPVVGGGTAADGGGEHQPKSYLPVLFWRTPKLRPDQLADIRAADNRADNRADGGGAGAPPSPSLKEKCLEVLSCHLAKHVHEYLFGVDSAGGEDRRVPVYIVSGDAAQNGLLETMWMGVECTVHVLEARDFFSTEEGLVSSMEVTRLAALRGASFLHGVPTLVFDAGAMLSYAATDRTGRLLGGGTGPGCDAKLGACNRQRRRAVTPEDVLEYTVRFAAHKRVLHTFATNVDDELMCDLLGDIHSKGRRVISQWMRVTERGEEEGAEGEGGKRNADRKVIVTGGDGVQVLVELLASDLIIDAEFDGIADPNYRIVHQKYLHHYGVTGVLHRDEVRRLSQPAEGEEAATERPPVPAAATTSPATLPSEGRQEPPPPPLAPVPPPARTDVAAPPSETSEDRTDDLILGQRVARWFPLDVGGREIFLGTVVGIQRPTEDHNVESICETWYLVNYDDGDREHVNFAQIEEMLRLYDRYGAEMDRTGQRARGPKDALGAHKKSRKIRKMEEEPHAVGRGAVHAPPAKGDKSVPRKPDSGGTEGGPKRKAEEAGATSHSKKGRTSDENSTQPAKGRGSPDPPSAPAAHKDNSSSTQKSSLEKSSLPVATAIPEEITHKKKTTPPPPIPKKKKEEPPPVTTAQPPDQKKQKPPPPPPPPHPAPKKPHPPPPLAPKPNKPHAARPSLPPPPSPPAEKKKKKKVAPVAAPPRTDAYLNRRVANYFDGDVYFGTITKCYRDDDMWHVRYDDGDREDYTYRELQGVFKLYAEKKKLDPHYSRRQKS